MALTRPVLLTLRALKLGDLLTAVPALRALRGAFPEHEHLLVAPAWLSPLVAHLGVVDRVVPSATDPLATATTFTHGPVPPVEVAVNLHGRGPQSTAHLRSLAPTRLIAFDAAPDGPIWRDEEHEVTRWCRLLRESGIPADPAARRVEVPDADPVPHAAGATLLHPGAASASRRWPVERWAEVARALSARGRRVVVTGGPGEENLAADLAARARLPRGAVVAGSLDVLELLAVVGRAETVVCGDTGVAHVASAVGTPSVVLFGPVAPALWGPPADDPRHIALWAGRCGDPHADVVDRGLLDISVGDALDAVAALERAVLRPGGPASR